MMVPHDMRDNVTLINEGKKLFAIFHRPIGLTTYPAVLICHGFAGTKVGRHRIYVNLSEALAAKGIASLRIDFRGCGDSEGSFEETTLEGQVSDALLGLNFLKNHPQVDPKNIGMLGRSMGGPIAVVAARRFGKVKSLALWCPVFSARPWLEEWEHVLQTSNGNGSGSSTVSFHGQTASQALFEQLFELQMERELADLAHVPLLHVHSELDEIVNISHADNYVRCRQAGSALSQFIRLKESDHEFSLIPERDHTVQETALWFQKTLTAP
jgi:pimeloyl-ACP methyl ester carboxylesterase